MYVLNLCLLKGLWMSSVGDGGDSRSPLRVSSEKSFHKWSLLTLPRLPAPHTSTTCRLGNKAWAWTSHTACRGDNIEPGGNFKKKVELSHGSLLLRYSLGVSLLTCGAQNLITDCPQVSGLSMWFNSQLNRKFGMWGNCSLLKLQLYS